MHSKCKCRGKSAKETEIVSLFCQITASIREACEMSQNIAKGRDDNLMGCIKLVDSSPPKVKAYEL